VGTGPVDDLHRTPGQHPFDLGNAGKQHVEVNERAIVPMVITDVFGEHRLPVKQPEEVVIATKARGVSHENLGSSHRHPSCRGSIDAVGKERKRDKGSHGRTLTGRQATRRR
jgi:hypothetical protein